VKILGPVMRFLAFDAADPGIQIPRAEGEGGVAALPGELRKGRGAVLEPLRGGGLQFANEIGEGERAGKPEGKVDMIGHAADAVAFSIVVAGDAGEIRVEFRADVRGE
jgi:hypothetical protein